MKASAYFHSLGQSDRSRNVPLAVRRAQSREWPEWARWAYHDGWTYQCVMRHRRH